MIISIIITSSEHILFLNGAIDEFTGTDPGLSPDTKRHLHPFEFRKFKDKPLEYGFLYRIKPSLNRRVILVSVPNTSIVRLSGEMLSDLAEGNETSQRCTYAGYIEPNVENSVLTVSSPSSKEPLIYISIKEIPNVEQ